MAKCHTERQAGDSRDIQYTERVNLLQRKLNKWLPLLTFSPFQLNVLTTLSVTKCFFKRKLKHLSLSDLFSTTAIFGTRTLIYYSTPHWLINIFKGLKILKYHLSKTFCAVSCCSQRKNIFFFHEKLVQKQREIENICQVILLVKGKLITLSFLK